MMTKDEIEMVLRFNEMAFAAMSIILTREIFQARGRLEELEAMPIEKQLVHAAGAAKPITKVVRKLWVEKHGSLDALDKAMRDRTNVIVGDNSSAVRDMMVAVANATATGNDTVH